MAKNKVNKTVSAAAIKNAESIAAMPNKRTNWAASVVRQIDEVVKADDSAASQRATLLLLCREGVAEGWLPLLKGDPAKLERAKLTGKDGWVVKTLAPTLMLTWGTEKQGRKRIMKEIAEALHVANYSGLLASVEDNYTNPSGRLYVKPAALPKDDYAKLPSDQVGLPVIAMSFRELHKVATREIGSKLEATERTKLSDAGRIAVRLAKLINENAEPAEYSADDFTAFTNAASAIATLFAKRKNLANAGGADSKEAEKRTATKTSKADDTQIGKQIAAVIQKGDKVA